MIFFKMTILPEIQDVESDSQGKRHRPLEVAQVSGRRFRVPGVQNHIYVAGFQRVTGNTPNPGHGKADGTGVLSLVLLG